MKKILASLAIVALLASSAHAVTRWSYNSSTFKQVRTLAQWYRGWNTQSVTYSYNACGALVVTVTQYAFGIVTNQTVTEFPCP